MKGRTRASSVRQERKKLGDLEETPGPCTGSGQFFTLEGIGTAMDEEQWNCRFDSARAMHEVDIKGSKTINLNAGLEVGKFVHRGFRISPGERVSPVSR